MASPNATAVSLLPAASTESEDGSNLTTESVTSMFSVSTPDTTHLDYQDIYDEYHYYSYPFEKHVYLYVWVILVIVTCLVNIIVISILVRKKMRNATNVILTAIAISDSLTGLVTLPTYIMVYQSVDEPIPYNNYDYYEDHATNYTLMSYSDYNSSNYELLLDMDVFPLSKGLCQWFMISRRFLSRSFHTISIFLTLCLGIQRFVSVAMPFSVRALTTRKAVVVCICIAVLSPFLHIYHLFNEKARHGLCEWIVEVGECRNDCIYLWVMFVLRQFLPCTMLIIFTILFIRELMIGDKGSTARRLVENRRIAIIVTAIVIIFLLAEIPYGVFTLYNSIDKTAYHGANIDAKRSKVVHLVYEILLVVSFHANFYIYTLFNRKFRHYLKRMFVLPLRKLVGDTRRVSVTSTSRSTQRQTELHSMKSGNAKDRNNHSQGTSITDKSLGESTGFMNSVSADITESSHPDKDETNPLNANV